jgi:hypothetical protein
MEISDQTTCLDRYFASFEESLSSRNYKPETLTNYRYLLLRFGRLLEAERFAPSEFDAGPRCRSRAAVADHTEEPDQGFQSCQAVRCASH